MARNNIVVVNNNQGQQPVHVFWVVFLVFVIVVYLKWILLAAALVSVAAWLATKITREHIRNEHFRQHLLAQNADLQNELALRGDPRGVYGLDWRPDDEGHNKAATQSRN